LLPFDKLQFDTFGEEVFVIVQGIGPVVRSVEADYWN
jgi:hypothetical protein